MENRYIALIGLKQYTDNESIGIIISSYANSDRNYTKDSPRDTENDKLVLKSSLEMIEKLVSKFGEKA